MAKSSVTKPAKAASKSTNTAPVTSQDILGINDQLWKARSLCRLLNSTFDGEIEERFLEIWDVVEEIEGKINLVIGQVNTLEGRAIRSGMVQEADHG